MASQATPRVNPLWLRLRRAGCFGSATQEMSATFLAERRAKLAVAFKPRSGCICNCASRRVATLDAGDSSVADATRGGRNRIRGLKATAIIDWSLRDRSKPDLRPHSERSEESSCASGRPHPVGFFAALRMTRVVFSSHSLRASMGAATSGPRDDRECAVAPIKTRSCVLPHGSAAPR